MLSHDPSSVFLPKEHMSKLGATEVHGLVRTSICQKPNYVFFLYLRDTNWNVMYILFDNTVLIYVIIALKSNRSRGNCQILVKNSNHYLSAIHSTFPQL